MGCAGFRAVKKPRQPIAIHIGCSGWFYWGWREKFYPLSVPTHKWFPYYTKHFKTVELNAPFYSWPKRSTVQCWIRQAPQDFRYSIKVNRLITHDFRMEGTAMLVEQFYLDVGVPLGERMACFLFQFPPSFRYTKKRLDALCKQLDPAYRNVVEFRHKSWWNPEVYKALRRRKIIMCAVSAPRIPDKLVRTARRHLRPPARDDEVVSARLHRRAARRVGGEDPSQRGEARVDLLRQRPRCARDQERRKRCGGCWHHV